MVSSNSDFTKLASRLRESEIFVFGVGEKKTPVSFRNACDDFVFTENLNLGEPLSEETPDPESTEVSDIKELVPLIWKAWEQYQDEDGWAHVSVAGSLVKRLKPDFDPRSYGARKITDIIYKLGDFFETQKIKGKGTAIIIAYKPAESQLAE